jgi:hypothetical protein
LAFFCSTLVKKQALSLAISLYVSAVADTTDNIEAMSPQASNWSFILALINQSVVENVQSWPKGKSHRLCKRGFDKSP